MKTLWTLAELEPYVDEPLYFSGQVDLEKKILERTKDILKAGPLNVEGYFFYNPQQEEYTLSLQVDVDLVLPSTRSLEPVPYALETEVNEIYLPSNTQTTEDAYEESEVVFVLEDNQIELEDVLIENVLLTLPTQILTEEERQTDDMPTGEDWQVLSESQFAEVKKEKRVENSPFQALKSLFPEEDIDEKSNEE